MDQMAAIKHDSIVTDANQFKFTNTGADSVTLKAHAVDVSAAKVCVSGAAANKVLQASDTDGTLSYVGYSTAR